MSADRRGRSARQDGEQNPAQRRDRRGRARTLRRRGLVEGGRVRCTVITANTPTGKPELALGQPARTERLIEIYDALGADLVLNQEFADASSAAIATVDSRARRLKGHGESGVGYRVHRGAANDDTPLRGRIGNTTLVRHGLKTDRLPDLILTFRDRDRGKRRPIHLPQVAVDIAESSTLTAPVATINVHLPTAGAASQRDRNRLLRQVSRRARALYRQGYTVIVAGDFNRRDTLKYLRGWDSYGEGIDQIIVSPNASHGGHDVMRKGVDGVVSDHPLVWAHVLVPTLVPAKEKP